LLETLANTATNYYQNWDTTFVKMFLTPDAIYETTATGGLSIYALGITTLSNKVTIKSR